MLQILFLKTEHTNDGTGFYRIENIERESMDCTAKQCATMDVGSRNI